MFWLAVITEGEALIASHLEELYTLGKYILGGVAICGGLLALQGVLRRFIA